MAVTQANSKRDLILLVSVPLILAAFLAAIVYLPQLLARPSYDFIYATCDSYRCSDEVNVRDGGVTIVNLQNQDSANKLVDDYKTSLRYYDVSKQSSRALTIDEARKYRLDNSSRSPDGYVLSHQSSSSGFLFWSEGNSQWILKSGLYKKPVDLTGPTSYYDNVTFVGWVK